MPPALAGRSDVVEDGKMLAARTSLGRYEKSLILVGLRGVGKTVLLKYLAESARVDGMVPVLVEMRNDPCDIEELSLRLKEALCLIDFKSRMKSVVNHAFAVLRNFVKTVSVNIGDVGVSVESAPAVGDSGNMEYDLSEVLLAAARAAKESKTAKGLYVDELQNLDAAALRGIIVALHHAAQDLLPLYLVGSGLPSVRGLIGKTKTCAERMFNYDVIGALSEQEVDFAVAGPLRENGVEMRPDAVRELHAISGGYPYFLQEYGYQIWLAAESDKVTRRDVVKIQSVVKERLDSNFFDVRFDRVANSERQFLRAMAECAADGVAKIADVAENLHRTLGSLSPVRSSLIRKGLIYSPSVGLVAYTVPMFGSYVKRVLPNF